MLANPSPSRISRNRLQGKLGEKTLDTSMILSTLTTLHLDPVNRLRRRTLPAVVGIACLAVFFNGARALTDEEIFRDLRFNFSSPGARAMALGGAFVGVADDATAADANPAGLCTVPDVQVFMEYGYSDAKDRDPIESNLGSLEINPVTGERDLPYLSLTSRANADSSGSPDFLGFVWPLMFGSNGLRWAVSGSRQVVLKDDRTLDGTETRFAFDDFPPDVVSGQTVVYSVAAPPTSSTGTRPPRSKSTRISRSVRRFLTPPWTRGRTAPHR
jgi:hypothetical protein